MRAVDAAVWVLAFVHKLKTNKTNNKQDAVSLHSTTRENTMAKMPTTTTQPPCSVSTSATPAGLAPGVSMSSRIPATLQSVFLASNRGQTVHKPPPAKVASKTFFRNWLFQGVAVGSGRSNNNNNKNSGTSKTGFSKTSSSSFGQAVRGAGGVSGLFSFTGRGSSSTPTKSSSSSTTTSVTTSLPSCGTRSPPRGATATNGSKYKIGSACSKKQTEALVHAAAERLQQHAQQQRGGQQQSSSVVRVAEPSAATSTTTTTASVSSPPPPTLDFRAARAASAVSEDDSETESNSSSSDVSVAAADSSSNNNNNTSRPSLVAVESHFTVTPQPEPAAILVVSPQDYLDNLLTSRGYSTRRFATLQTAYYNKPTVLQMASYHVHLINLARSGEDLHSFTALLSCGLSPNPANAHGESLLHTVCRRGLHTVLQCMLEQCHSSVVVADDYGRTPLHDAMWNNTPSPPTISLLLQHGDACDLFFLQDARGALPLQYARQEHWPVWTSYLQHVQDVYWPVRNISEQGVKEPSPLLLAPPGSHPLVDPVHALPLDVAVLVASGKLSPTEAVFLVDEEQNESESDEESDDESDDDDESGNDDDMSQEEGSSCDDDDSDDSDDDGDDDSDDDSSWDEEMDDMLQQLPATATAKRMP